VKRANDTNYSDLGSSDIGNGNTLRLISNLYEAGLSYGVLIEFTSTVVTGRLRVANFRDAPTLNANDQAAGCSLSWWRAGGRRTR